MKVYGTVFAVVNIKTLEIYDNGLIPLLFTHAASAHSAVAAIKAKKYPIWALWN